MTMVVLLGRGCDCSEVTQSICVRFICACRVDTIGAEAVFVKDVEALVKPLEELPGGWEEQDDANLTSVHVPVPTHHVQSTNLRYSGRSIRYLEIIVTAE